MGTEDALVFTTGYQANLGCLSAILGRLRHRDRRLRRPRLDPRRLQALGRPPAALPPPAPGQARADARAGRRRRRRRAGGRGRRLLDGGRHLRRQRGRGALPRLRRAPDGGRGPRGRRARAARDGRCELYGAEDRVDLRMGTFSKSLASCGGFIAGPGGGDRLPADRLPPVPVHRLGRAGGDGGRARGGPDLPLRRGAGAVRARARQRRLPAPRPAGARLPGRRAQPAGRRQRGRSRRSCRS